MKYTLLRAITVIDRQITAITFREPTGDDLVGLPDPTKDPLGFSILLADRLADNVPPGTVRGLRGIDAMGAGKTVMPAMDPTIPPSFSTDTSSAPGGGTTAAS